MQKSEDAAIPMPLNSEQFIVGNADILAAMPELKALPPFSEEAVSFLNALSALLLKTGKAWSDVATFAFWCRKSALMKEKEKYDDLNHRLGRGIIFHSTPSNVPVNFAFSFAAGLLAGNANIVRLPAKDFEQVNVICNAVNELLNGEFRFLAPYVCMVKYAPDKAVSDMLSAICDVRIVWGGDMTISEMRRSPLKPRATEITFADRHSILVINADEYLKIENKARTAQDFYNDTFFSDQNACTSPRIIIWMGREKEKAKKLFWDNIHALAKEKYTLAPVQAVGKLAAFYRTAAKKDVRLIPTEDNLITRIAVKELSCDLPDYKYNSGFFFEYDANELKDICPVCTEKCQTMTYIGLTKEQLEDFFKNAAPKGVDRAVPVGKSMDFTLDWDGFDLIRQMSRKVVF